MTLLSVFGFRPQKQEEMSTPLHAQCSDISIIIPVRNNQEGIDLFLAEFLQTHIPEMYPAEIIIIDNNSRPRITVSQHYRDTGLKITLLFCPATGPACARNLGVHHTQTDWILFTDSDCIPSPSFIMGYLTVLDGSVGYAGNVRAWGNDNLSKYYESQEILLPSLTTVDGTKRPEYLITANSLVWKPAFEYIGGFNETITIAAGEDIDLGFRLREVGSLSVALTSSVYHNFDGGLLKFCRRFVRYGKGNKIISKLYRINLTPKPFKPKSCTPVNRVLAKLQYVCLLWGYVMNKPYRVAS